MWTLCFPFCQNEICCQPFYTPKLHFGLQSAGFRLWDRKYTEYWFFFPFKHDCDSKMFFFVRIVMIDCFLSPFGVILALPCWFQSFVLFSTWLHVHLGFFLFFKAFLTFSSGEHLKSWCMIYKQCSSFIKCLNFNSVLYPCAIVAVFSD